VIVNRSGAEPLLAAEAERLGYGSRPNHPAHPSFARCQRNRVRSAACEGVDRGKVPEVVAALIAGKGMYHQNETMH